MRVKWTVVFALLLALALGLAACGGDDDNTDTATPEPTEEQSEGASGAFSPNAPSLSLGADLIGENALPGCSDADDDECPAALLMDLDGELSAGGVTISYPARYFDAAAIDDAPDGKVIAIVPSENNRYAEDARFAVYLSDTPESALDALTDPDSAKWTTDTLTGTIAVGKDDTQEPPVNTTVGAFTAEDGRGVVFELVTTGKYGWDLWSRVYEIMLQSLVLAPAE